MRIFFIALALLAFGLTGFGMVLRHGSDSVYASASMLSPNRAATMVTESLYGGDRVDIVDGTVAAVYNPQSFPVSAHLDCANGAGAATPRLPAALLGHYRYSYGSPRIAGVLHCTVGALPQGQHVDLRIAVLQ